MKNLLSCFALGFLLLGRENVWTSDIVNDQFADADRTSQTPALGSPPYSSLHWYSNAADAVTTGTGGLSQSLGTTPRTLWSYFTPQGSPTSLAPGELLRVTFDYTYSVNTGGSSGMMRFGLYDAGSATRFTTEGTIASPSTFASSTVKGYGFEINPQAASATGGVAKRDINSATDTALFGGAGYATVGATFATTDAGATTHTAEITALNTGSSTVLTLNLDLTGSGTAVTITDSGSTRITSFDMLAFLNYSNSGSNTVRFDNIHVERPSGTSTIIDEQFTDGERVTQTPALGTPPCTSLRWVSTQADTVSASAIGLSQIMGSGARSLWSYFTTQGSPITLGKNDSTTLTFDYTYTTDTGGISGMMRFGLFNGGTAARSFTEGTSASPSFFSQNTVKGYTVETNAQAASASGAVLKRENNNGVTGGLFSSGTGGSYNTVKTAAGSDTFASIDATTVTRKAKVTITNKGSWNEIIVNLDANNPSGAVTFNETGTDRITSFDMLGFLNYSNTGANAITIDNVHLDYTHTGDVSTGPTDGGDGGQVVTVTSLADSGTGTLRDALSMTMPRTIKFTVGGEILLNSQLVVSSPCVTVDGLSAPSPGIGVKGDRLWISPASHDVAIRHLRIRVGELVTSPHTSADTHDGISCNTSNVLIENCSVSWSVDELMEVWGTNLSNITIRNNIFAEALKTSVHPKGDHSMGLLIGPSSRNVLIQGNLFAHNVHRNPVVHANAQALIVNNLIYQPGFEGFHIYTDPDYPGATLASVVGNKIIGWASGVWLRTRYPLCADGYNPGTQIYYNDNLVEGTTLAFDPAETFGTPPQAVPVVSTPPIAISVTPLASTLVESAVLSNAGARPAERDATDTRIINEVTTRTGSIRDNPTDPSITVP